MSSTDATNVTTIVIDPPQSRDDDQASPTRSPTLYPPPAAATANHEQSAPSGETATLTPAMQVRMSLLRRLWAATVNMQGVRRRRIALFGTIGVAQLIAWIVILAMKYDTPCDRPLALYLLLTCVRIALAFPLSYYNAVTPRPLRRNADEETRLASEAGRLVGSADLDRRVRFIGDAVALASFILFIIGNFWMVTTETCSRTSPTLYNAALAALIFSWLWTAELVIYVILVIFFLPFFLLGMRFFGLGQAKNEVGPLSKSGIENLPQRIYVGVTPVTEDSGAVASKSTETLAQQPTTATVTPVQQKTAPSTASSRRQFWRLWRRPPAQRAAAAERISALAAYPPFPAGVEPIRLPESQAACCICLCEFELPPARESAEAASWEPELLRILPCGHALHSVCLDEWLRVSGRCPICQRPVQEPKGKKSRKGSTRGDSAAAPSSSLST
ncbi:hypothetical protein C6P46_005796 [Rhodotorula mucilaginosa]|uniref:RING-type E3 ubiquitin transferase n=1 Tax=Rhodotorula mucilaginosa TaxID=5537 RepID=A0A9P7B4Q7_RHOMI|nr:hypothetical protein C6P46_005796 [Rhodotorula mucilaginosa]